MNYTDIIQPLVESVRDHKAATVLSKIMNWACVPI